MPSSDPMQRFIDIVENIERIEAYTNGLNRDQFVQDSLRADAVERCLSRISEAAIKLGDIASQVAPDIPWSDIRGIGNILRHEYSIVDRVRIWQTVQRDLPPLKAACKRALLSLGRGS